MYEARPAVAPYHQRSLFTDHGSRVFQCGGVGRGYGVGRDLGVALGVPLGVGLAVGVPVGVGLTVALGVGVGGGVAVFTALATLLAYYYREVSVIETFEVHAEALYEKRFKPLGA